MNLIAVANETLQIIENGQYELNGKMIKLPECDYSDALVYSPDDGKRMLTEYDESKESIDFETSDKCKIIITTEDSYQAASRYDNAFVMNFANAHNPGGGFRLGATAQEEALCRCSTLYESINSKKASDMYKYNNTHLSMVESDYMLLSKVCVFRDNKCNLLEEPFMTGVITIPAPNRMGAAMLASDKQIAETMLRRIRIMLLIARENGYKNLVLGAWGCGAFHNDPVKVASYFKTVLMDEGYCKFFDEVCFAIYGKEDGYNIKAFRNCFGQ